MDMPKSGGIYLISDSKNLAIDDLLDKTEKNTRRWDITFSIS